MFDAPSIMYCKSFEGVFQSVQSGLCRFGLLPIENSSYGSVGAVYDLMRNYNFSIVRSDEAACGSLSSRKARHDA